TDILRARQLVEERLVLAGGPVPAGGGAPVMLQTLSGASRPPKIGLSSKQMSLLGFSVAGFLENRIPPLRVPGVADVAIWGERLKQLQIQLDPERMRLHQVSLNDVLEASSAALNFGLLHNTPSAKTQVVGFLETPNQRLEINTVSPVVSPED